MESLTPERAPNGQKLEKKEEDPLAYSYYGWVALALFIGGLGKGLNEVMDIREKAERWRLQTAESRKLTAEMLDKLAKQEEQEGVDSLGVLQINQLDRQKRWTMNMLDSEEVRSKLSPEEIQVVKNVVELTVSKEKAEIKLNFSEKK